MIGAVIKIVDLIDTSLFIWNESILSFWGYHLQALHAQTCQSFKPATEGFSGFIINVMFKLYEAANRQWVKFSVHGS